MPWYNTLKESAILKRKHHFINLLTLFSHILLSVPHTRPKKFKEKI